MLAHDASRLVTCRVGRGGWHHVRADGVLLGRVEVLFVLVLVFVLVVVVVVVVVFIVVFLVSVQGGGLGEGGVVVVVVVVAVVVVVTVIVVGVVHTIIVAIVVCNPIIIVVVHATTKTSQPTLLQAIRPGLRVTVVLILARATLAEEVWRRVRDSSYTSGAAKDIMLV